jgi:hypothetical protein
MQNGQGLDREMCVGGKWQQIRTAYNAYCPDAPATGGACKGNVTVECDYPQAPDCTIICPCNVDPQNITTQMGTFTCYNTCDCNPVIPAEAATCNGLEPYGGVPGGCPFSILGKSCIKYCGSNATSCQSLTSTCQAIPLSLGTGEPAQWSGMYAASMGCTH